MIKQLVRMKLAQTSPKEIVQYSQRYNIPLTMRQSEELLDFIHTKKSTLFGKGSIENIFLY